ncbi:MAG: hypothetical protein ACKOSQ_04515 [Planctomycetaceae bacterium]
MNYLGKIFVFAVFIMSLVLMSFAGAVFLSHTNWQEEIERKPEECKAGQRPGYKHLLSEAEKERQGLQEEITRLTQKVSESEQARDQVVAKLQSALKEKTAVLDGLRREKADREEAQRTAIRELEEAQVALKDATALVEKLRVDVRDQQKKVDERVETASKLAADLEESKALLAVANERREQLEKQVANARVLLKQGGLTLDSLPKDRVPTLDGAVVAVADTAIELSLGGDDGLQAGHVVEVYRSGEYIGRAKVLRVTHDRAVAEIVKEFSRGIVQRGDRFTTRLKG